jgi:hypothetical protein
VGSSSPSKSYSTSTTTFSPKQLLEQNGDLQIMRIGADIIDCAKTDNYPTNLMLGTYPVHGVQDLPYLYGVLTANLLKTTQILPATTPTTATLNWGSLVLVPLLFNPAAAAAAGSPTLASPDQLELVVTSGKLDTVALSLYTDPVSTPQSSYLYEAPGLNLVNTTTKIVFPLDTAGAALYRGQLSPVTNASTSSTLLSTLVPQATTTKENGFLVYSYPSNTGPFINTGKGSLRATFEHLCIELKYHSPGGNWITYDTLMGNEGDQTTSIGGNTSVFIDFGPSEPFNTRTSVDGVTDQGSGAILKIDPRTSRFGAGFTSAFPLVPTPNPATLINGLTDRVAVLPVAAGGETASPGIMPGLWMQGNTSNTSSTASGNAIMNIADADGVTRPADGWLGAGGTTPGPGNLFSNLSTTNTARPTLLHRPYESVAELGYVFRDSPWKSLNLFDPTSGDGALADYFSVVDEPPVSSGRINLNTRQPLVLQALLSGAALDPSQSNSAVLPAPAAIASSLVGKSGSYSIDNNGNPVTTLPTNLAQLPGYIGSVAFANVFPYGSDSVEYEREAVARALAGSCQTRTWNLLIDVVAQSGKFPASSLSGSNFIVQGERHYWFSIAIDRLTDSIIAQQVEAVDE